MYVGMQRPHYDMPSYQLHVEKVRVLVVEA